MSEPEIEFLVDGDEPGDFEELAQPTGREWRRWRRARVPIAIVLGLAVVGAGVVRAWPSHHGARPAAAAITLPAPALAPVIAVRPSAAVDPAACPAYITCLATHTVPPEVLRAVRDAFPGARLMSATNVLADHDHVGSYVWYRKVTARVGTTTISVVVRQPAAADDLHGVLVTSDITPIPGDFGGPHTIDIDGIPAIASVQRRSGALTVAVEVHFPGLARVSQNLVVGLAGDRRLLVAG
jgi:hypothetical protein